MSILKFNKGRRGASGTNVSYIMRGSACQDVSFHNLDELKTDDLEESKINARSYAYAREDVEQAKDAKGITHYRMVLSFDRQEDNDRAREQAHKFLQEHFKDSRAIVAIHQDTEHTHAHIWIDSRQTNEKKIQIKPTQWKTLDEKFAKQYDREYGTNYAPEYKAKKQQTKEFKKQLSKEPRQGKQSRPANKPARHKDQMTSEFFREKEARDKGVKRNDESRAGRNQRAFEVRDRQSEKANQAIAGSEHQINRGKQETDRATGSINQAKSGVREFREQLDKILESEKRQQLEKNKENDKGYER